MAISIVTFKAGITALWSTATNRNAKIGATFITIIFLICLVIGMLLLLPADATQNLSWTPFHDACSARPCGTHGSCMDLPGTQDNMELEYTCLCNNGWAGPTCEVALACASSPCQPGGGVCEDESDGSFVCVCNPGYTGELCDQVGAGKPCETLRLTNGQLNGQCSEPGNAGGSCFLTCVAPYLLFSEGVLSSSVTRSCQPDGTWTGTMPLCERPDCGRTAAVAYSVQGSSLTQMAPCSGDTLYGGDACSISCAAGFYLSSGSATLTCGVDGNWIGEPQCSQNCGNLTLDDGSASGRCDGNVGDSCSLSCDANFLLHVDGAVIAGSFVTRTCNPDGTWTGAMPSCLRPDCGATVAVAYSTASVDSTRSATCSGDTLYGGDSCPISCDTGFYLSSGSATLTCGTGGTWLGSPVCSECTDIPRCAGDVTCTGDSDQQCSQCEAGYTANAQCGIIDCGPTIAGLDSQATASCTGDTQYGGDDCTAACNEGWQSAAGVHQGTAVFSCSASAEAWAGSLVCSPMSCGALTLDDGSASGRCDGNVGDSCSLSCDANFLLHSTAGALLGLNFVTRTCSSDGTWTGDMPQCLRPDCVSSPMIAYSTASTDSIRLATCSGNTLYGGDACVVSCEQGFFLSSGPSELTCGADGNWVGEPRCSQNCGILDLEHGSESGQCTGNVGDSCTMLSCDVGYQPSDNSLVNTARECQTDGSWSGSELLCIGIPCWANTEIANSDRTADNPCVTRTGDDCDFVCNPGFHVQGV
eukprot:COSAG03_NODE_1807_length_3485_cov_12.861488_1_plen_755_part_10